MEAKVSSIAASTKRLDNPEPIPMEQPTKSEYGPTGTIDDDAVIKFNASSDEGRGNPKGIEPRNKFEATQSFLSIVMALLTAASVGTTYLLLAQQRKEEQIQYRAYVAINSVNLYPNDKDDASHFQFKLTLTLANAGTTPAHSMKVRRYLLVNDAISEEFTNSNENFLGPNQDIDLNTGLNENVFQTAQIESGNFVVSETRYLDYANFEHKLVTRLQFARKKDGTYFPIIHDQAEAY
ncbi:MAG TPA: hypothetical protein VE422_30485 [Terriglobia bacterium]|nr:hypothetical protein [Terriglobia bacterium]